MQTAKPLFGEASGIVQNDAQGVERLSKVVLGASGGLELIKSTNVPVTRGRLGWPLPSVDAAYTLTETSGSCHQSQPFFRNAQQAEIRTRPSTRLERRGAQETGTGPYADNPGGDIWSACDLPLPTSSWQEYDQLVLFQRDRNNERTDSLRDRAQADFQKQRSIHTDE